MAEREPKAGGEIAVYEDPDGEVRIDVRLERETVWLSQRQMAEVFDTSTDNVGLHLENVFSEGELDEGATTEDGSVVQTAGRRRVRRTVRHYNLDAILSVGYRVSSKRGTQFRVWATRGDRVQGSARGSLDSSPRRAARSESRWRCTWRRFHVSPG